MDRIAAGRTDLVFEHWALGQPATAADAQGVFIRPQRRSMAENLQGAAHV